MSDLNFIKKGGNYYYPVDKYAREELNKIGDGGVTYNYVTPEMYGAVGDGVTDDTTAIQSAIDSVGLLSKRVYMGNKNYKTTAPIVINKSDVIFHCDGVISYEGSAHAVEVSGETNQVLHCDIYINKIESNGAGLKIYTATNPVCYNNFKINKIEADTVGVDVECQDSYINENTYYLGRVSRCTNAIKLFSNESLSTNNGFGTNTNRFLRGIFEGIKEDGCAVVIDHSNDNKFKNIRCNENYGSNSVKFKGQCSRNELEFNIKLHEVDISELTDGSYLNILKGKLTFNDEGYNGITEAILRYDWGIVYNPKYADKETYLRAETFEDNVISKVNNLIPICLSCATSDLNNTVFTFHKFFTDEGSPVRGYPIVFKFGANGGYLKLVDSTGNTILDNTDGSYSGKTIVVRWVGYDKIDKKNMWKIEHIY